MSPNSKSHPFGRSNWIVPIKLDYPPHFIEVAVRSQKSQRSSICELLMFSLSTNFLQDFGIVPTVCYFLLDIGIVQKALNFFYQILELYRQRGICSIRFQNCTDSVIFLQLEFRIVPTVWYFSIIFWNCADSVVFFYQILELYRQCDIFSIRSQNCTDSVVFFLLDFRIVPTVWYFFYQILELYRMCGILL